VRRGRDIEGREYVQLTSKRLAQKVIELLKGPKDSTRAIGVENCC
jgi:hypothetical protein